MDAAAIPSMWASVHSWFTPTVLFLLLNLVIGTIAVASKSSRPPPSSEPDHPTPPASLLCRSPSLVLERLKSFSFYRYDPPIPNSETLEIPTQTQQAEEETAAAQTEPADPVDASSAHIHRSQSDTKPSAGERPEKLAKKMKKSATMKSAFKHFVFGGEEEEEEIKPKRPVTMREREREREEDVEVDARADDFINRFRQQLKLQRLDSIIRYKEMLKRGS